MKFEFKKYNEIENSYRTEFLNEMLTFAEYYAQIVEPSLSHYKNRQEYLWLVQSLKHLDDTFNVVQVRVPLMALMHAKKKKIIDMEHFKRAINYLENFHFAFNVVVSDRGNKLDSNYSAFAIASLDTPPKRQVNLRFSFFDFKMIIISSVDSTL